MSETTESSMINMGDTTTINNYVPVVNDDGENKNSTSITINESSSMNVTNSNANVYNGITDIGKDPLEMNAQQQNPFLANRMGGGGGINPQIAMILRNNPRLQLLAQQNPVMAQQIMRNPQLLRDPIIQRAIQSQLSPGQQQGLLGQIGQIGLTGLNGLGRALGGLNPLNNNNNNNMNQMNNQNRRMNPNHNHQTFGLPQPRQHQNFGHANPNQDRLNGGYYGGNDNYANQPAPETNEIDDGSSSQGEDGDDQNDPGQQDYGGGGGGEDNGNAGEDSQQNPADDPDIQQLQNFGGPMNDNFPEGLFPPGLLSKDDIAEIRRQQEKQQREDMERERRQQHGQTSPDYDNTGTGEENNDGGDGDGSEHQDTEYPEGAGDGEQDHNGENSNNEIPNENDQTNANVEDGHIINTTPIPPQLPLQPAYKNAYQPIQPQYRNNIQPINEFQNIPQNNHHHRHPSKNQFNQQLSNVEYDPNNDHGHHHHHNYNNQHPMGYATTFAPPISAANPGVHYDDNDDYNDSGILNRGYGQQLSNGYHRNQPNIHNQQHNSRSKTLQQQWPGSHQPNSFSTMNRNDQDILRRSTLLQDDEAINPRNMGMRSPPLYSNFVNNNNRFRPDRRMDKQRGLMNQQRGLLF